MSLHHRQGFALRAVVNTSRLALHFEDYVFRIYSYCPGLRPHEQRRPCGLVEPDELEHCVAFAVCCPLFVLPIVLTIQAMEKKKKV